MRLTFIAVPFAMALATPAFAQDDPPAPPAPSLGGFRIEGIVGYDATAISSDDDGGVVYGIGAGYDFQVGRRVVLGIDAEASESTNDGCELNIAQPGDSICVSTGRDLYVGGRAGVLLGNRWQLYARAGYTNARIRVAYDDGVAGSAGDFSFANDLDGVRVGAGAQFRVGQRAYLGAEYRYSNYEGGGDRGQIVSTLGFRF